MSVCFCFSNKNNSVILTLNFYGSTGNHYIQHETIIQTGIICKQNKSLLNSACLWSIAWLAVNKKQKYFSLPGIAENLWFLQKDKTLIKENLYLICRNYSHNYFHIKMSLKLLVKYLQHNTFSLITWNTKLVNYATCRTPSTNPGQVCAHNLKISSTIFNS